MYLGATDPKVKIRQIQEAQGDKMARFRVKMQLQGKDKFEPAMIWQRDIDATTRTQAEYTALAKEPSGTKVIDSYMIED